MGNLLDHAKRELDLIGMTENSENMDVRMRNHILHMVEEFANEGHSGFLASYAIGALEKLLSFEPLSPLTGEDSEWNDLTESYGNNGDTLYQNNRCSRVFKDNNGAYDIDGKVFVTPDKGSYTNFKSRVPVTFPYTPKTEYVEVAE